MTQPSQAHERDTDRWIEDLGRVQVVLYDPEVEAGRPLVMSGRVNAGVYGFWARWLDAEGVSQLEKTIQCSPPPPGALCYLPHHGLIFYDRNAELVGHLEICFLCRNYRISGKDTPRNWDLLALRELFLGLKLPVFRSLDEWAEFHEENKEVEQVEVADPAHANSVAREGRP